MLSDMAYDAIDFNPRIRSEFQIRDHARHRSIETMKRKEFPITFTYVDVERKFGEFVALQVWRIVYESIRFSILRHRKYAVCINDLTNDAVEEIARVLIQGLGGI